MTSPALVVTPVYARRPPSWRRLLWVAWRRYRSTLIGVSALLIVEALYLVVNGLRMRSAYSAAQACTPQASPGCHFAFDTFHHSYANGGFVGGILVWTPAVIGAFAGAPLLARELETGTFRFAWTQGVGRMRWVVAHLVPGLLGVAVLSAAFGLLVTWYDHPLVATGIEPKLHASEFPLTGTAVVGWAVAAYALGAFAGVLVRRVVPALAAALGVWTGLAFLAAEGLRSHYMAPLVATRLQLAGGDLPIHQWWTRGGARVSNAQVNQVLQAVGVQTDGNGDFQARVGRSGHTIDPVQYLIAHGYQQATSYQPGSRYWPFQWIEFGWLAVLSAVLLAATLWLVRRRAA